MKLDVFGLNASWNTNHISESKALQGVNRDNLKKKNAMGNQFMYGKQRLREQKSDRP